MRKKEFRVLLKPIKKATITQDYPLVIEDNLKMLNDVFKDNDVIFMQYTGIKDKYGKKIYEGDIIEYKTNGWDREKQGYTKDRSVVKYENYGYYPFIKQFVKRPENYDDYNIYSWLIDDIEIVGNIYENKEKK